MIISDKGQVTIPKDIRNAAGVGPGSEVSFSLEGSRIVITPVATSVRDDRSERFRIAAAKVRASMSPEFRRMSSEEIMQFLRGDPPVKPKLRRGGA